MPLNYLLCISIELIFNDNNYIQTQADPPEPEHEHRQEVPGVREDVRQHARPLHARPHSQPQPQVQHLWEGVLQTLASEGSP